MGKVNFPDASGTRTISFTVALQQRQTPAHAAAPVHRASSSSTLASTIRRRAGRARAAAVAVDAEPGGRERGFFPTE